MNDFKERSHTETKTMTSPLPFSLSNSYLVICFFIVIAIVAMVYAAMTIPVNGFVQIGLFLLGTIFFTLIEYLFHRYAWHHGDYMNKDKWQYKNHGLHHDHPKDKENLAMPLPLAIVLATGFFILYRWALGQFVYFFFAGFVFGYAAYLFVHYTVHTRRPPKNALRYLWKHHHIHHHKHNDKAYGVSSPLWDIIFNTMPPRRERG